MCGFAGFLSVNSADPQERLCEIAGRMAATLQHRGPDDCGVWADADAGYAVGFRRLSIIDLTPSGHQPMLSPSGRFVIAYNGEVYNHSELRSILDKDHGVRFRGNSDTEVILAAVEEWGLERALERFVGMFAFALWDRRKRRLLLARDRLGVKPLYYGTCGQTFLFASELKAIRAHPDFIPEVDRDALVPFLRYGYVPAPRSIYRGIHKLPAGCVLEVGDTGPAPAPRPYWSAESIALAGLESRISDADSAANELETILHESVRLRMISDVPLGVFLSGGIDSSLVTALMREHSPGTVKTFSIGFREASYDEAAWARRVSQHLRTDHTELYVTSTDAMRVVPRLPTVYDEPFADASQIPTLLVSQLAREKVTVALSGDGGDELFGGYTRYLWGPGAWARLCRLPIPARKAAGRLLRGLPPAALSLAELALRRRERNAVDKIRKLAQAFDSNSEGRFVRSIHSHWVNPESVVLGAADSEEFLVCANSGMTFAERMMLSDQGRYLPDDILVKVDRASMAVGLEAREPLLDHRLFAFSWRVPLSMKIVDGKGKWLLRQVLYRHVPAELVERPKAGFTLPLDGWLRGPLREWAAALLEPARLRREGYFNPEAVETAWREHQSGRRNRQLALWDILMFQAWLEHFGLGQ